MKITRIKAHPISTPFDKVYWTARGAWGTVNMVIVTVETDEGITGIGQINKTPLKEIAEIPTALESVVQGMDALAHAAVWNKVFHAHRAAPRTRSDFGDAAEVHRRQAHPDHGRSRGHRPRAVGHQGQSAEDADLAAARLLGDSRREVPAYASASYYEEGRSP